MPCFGPAGMPGSALSGRTAKSKQPARLVVGRAAMLFRERFYFGEERIDLVRRGSDEAGVLGQNELQRAFPESDSAISREARHQICIDRKSTRLNSSHLVTSY